MKFTLRTSLLVVACAMQLNAAQAQEYPTKTVKLVVPYLPGGTADIVGRLIAQKLQEKLGQPFIIENKAGSGGNIGSEAVAKSAPDGYTLLLAPGGPMTINPVVYAKMNFNPVVDFQPISNVALVMNVMLVSPQLPVATVQDFVAWAKSQEKAVFYASPGNGNLAHLAGELFNMRTGTKMEHLAYRGAAPALQDLIGRQGPAVFFDNLPSGASHIKGGSLKALAVTGGHRAPAFPDVPTLEEAGVNDFNVSTWFGVITRNGTPRSIIDKLHKAIAASVREPDVAKRLEDLGAEPIGNSPEEFAQQIANDLRRWRRVNDIAKIRIE